MYYKRYCRSNVQCHRPICINLLYVCTQTRVTWIFKRHTQHDHITSCFRLNISKQITMSWTSLQHVSSSPKSSGQDVVTLAKNCLQYVHSAFIITSRYVHADLVPSAVRSYLVQIDEIARLSTNLWQAIRYFTFKLDQTRPQPVLQYFWTGLNVLRTDSVRPGL